MSYEELQKTELFSFFHFTESGRRQSPDGFQEIHFKPGGFPEFIDVQMKVDRTQMVHEGILYLDRDWIGGPMTVNPFGKDLAKSFIAAVCPAKDKKNVERVVSTIWNLQGNSDKVIPLHPDGPDDLTKEVPIEEIEQVYLGTSKIFEMTCEESCIKIENVVDIGKNRLKITIETR